MDNDIEFDSQQQKQEQDEHEQWLIENECCVYCGQPKAGKLSCCGEVHFYGEN